ncbi:MAG: D-glycero-beta-D-manno-heptose 1-phosphate adenylyltransferase [Bacteroidota bacterium]|nr:D-glycero-beta-D-manno-heptose 1-phosphate adenylyltransferase [Bacteroidota bacterium]
MNPSEQILCKIITPHALPTLLQKWQGEKVVFTNGCFDIIHRGHIDYLAKAKALGTKLFVGINTDSSVSTLKGSHRPLQDEQSRLQIMAAFFFVDAVMLFNEDTPFNLIKSIQPDVLVKGGDYIPENIVGFDIVTEKGGLVTTIPFLPGYSTSGIERKIILVHSSK